MVRLGLRVPFRKTQTLCSFASSLGAVNRQPNVRDFASDVGLKFTQVVFGEDEAINKLAALTDVDPLELRCSTLTKVHGRRWRIGSERLYSRVLTSPTSERCCPACLSDDVSSSILAPDASVYQRVHWRLSFFRTCPLHSLALVNMHASPLPHYRTNDFAWVYRAYMRHQQPAALEEREASALERAVDDRLNGSVPDQARWVDSLGLGAMGRFSEILGAVLLFGPQILLETLEERAMHQAADRGFSVLQEGPTALKQTLQDLAKRSSGEGLVRAIGQIFFFLHNTRDEDAKPIADVVRDFATETYAIKPGKTFLGKVVEERRNYSLMAAAATHQVTPYMTRRLLAQSGLWTADRRGSRRGLVGTSPAAIDAILSKVKDGLTTEEAVERLHMPVSHLTQLVRAGIIRPIGGDSSMHKIYSPSDLDNFLVRVMKYTQTCHSKPPGAVDLIQACASRVVSPATLVLMIMENQLGWVGLDPSASGYSSLLVRPREVRAVTRRSNLRNSLYGQLRWLGLDAGAVFGLIELGMIKFETVSVVGQPDHRTMTPEQMASFRAEYATLSDIGRMKGRARPTRAYLASLGIQPIQEALKFGAVIYRREDL